MRLVPRCLSGILQVVGTIIGGNYAWSSSSFVWSSSFVFSWTSPFSAYWSDPDRVSDVMLCRDPFVKAGAAYPCGRCDPCLHQRRRVWTHRLMMEAMCHKENCFLTLTYADKNLPMTSPLGGVELASLSPVHLRDWLKRCRAAIYPLRMRFYAVGEYGDRYERPHYHVVLFGFRTCRRGRTNCVPGSLEPDWEHCCDRCRLVGETWGFGNVDLGHLTKDSAGYVAGYVMKKMTRFDDIRLNGRYPEFARRSLKPGIGHDALWEVASTLLEYDLHEGRDVPSAIRVAVKQMPLGRYLRSKLRGMVGHDSKAPPEVIDALKAELLPVRDFAFNNSRSFKETLKEVFEGEFANFEAKAKLFKQRREM